MCGGLYWSPPLRLYCATIIKLFKKTKKQNWHTVTGWKNVSSGPKVDGNTDEQVLKAPPNLCLSFVTQQSYTNSVEDAQNRIRKANEGLYICDKK